MFCDNWKSALYSIIHSRDTLTTEMGTEMGTVWRGWPYLLKSVHLRTKVRRKDCLYTPWRFANM